MPAYVMDAWVIVCGVALFVIGYISDEILVAMIGGAFVGLGLGFAWIQGR